MTDPTTTNALIEHLLGPAAMLLVGAVISRLVQKTKKVAVEARDIAQCAVDQVQNDHKTNLRDDIDALSKALTTSTLTLRREITTLHDSVRGQNGDIAGIRRDVTDLRDQDRMGRDHLQMLDEEVRVLRDKTKGLP